MEFVVEVGGVLVRACLWSAVLERVKKLMGRDARNIGRVALRVREPHLHLHNNVFTGIVGGPRDDLRSIVSSDILHFDIARRQYEFIYPGN